MKGLSGVALAALLAFGVAGSSGAATLPYSGTLTFQLSALPGLTAVGGGTLQVNGTATGSHLSSLVIGAGNLGPVSASLPVTSNATINSVIFTAMANASGAFSPGAGPGGGFGGPVGLSGTAKICLAFTICQYSAVAVPLTPAAGSGFGVGGTQTIPGGVSITMQHNAWTVGSPTITLHTPNSTVQVPNLPGGFAHGPATVTGLSSVAQSSGVVQLVTVFKTYTSLAGAFPELPLIGILNIHFIPEPGTLLLLASGVVGLAVFGRRHRSR